MSLGQFVAAGEPMRLEGEGLVLREWTEGDLDVMVQLFDEPIVAWRTGSATRSPPNYNRQTPTTTRNRDGARARRRRRSRTSRNAATACPAPCGSVKVRLHSPRGTWLHLEAQVALAKFFQLGAGSYVAPTVRTVQALPREDWLPRALPGCGAAARADLRSSPSRCAAGRSRCSAHSVLAYRIRGR